MRCGVLLAACVRDYPPAPSAPDTLAGPVPRHATRPVVPPRPPQSHACIGLMPGPSSPCARLRANGPGRSQAWYYAWARARGKGLMDRGQMGFGKLGGGDYLPSDFWDGCITSLQTSVMST
jgi:hypothetical protein